MINFIRDILAAPFRLLIFLCSLMPLFDIIWLFKVVWNITHSIDDACNLIVITARQHGIDAAADLAEHLLEEKKDCSIASIMGWLEIQHKNNYEGAKEWIILAEQNNYQKPETLLKLKLLLSNVTDDFDKDIIVEQILAANYLQADVTLLALIHKSFSLIKEKSWQQAHQIAKKILAVQENPEARVAMWVTNQALGDRTESQKHFEKAQKLIPPDIFAAMAAEGFYQLGDENQALEWLYEAENRGLNLSQLKNTVKELAKSDKYYNYKRNQP